MQIHITLLYFTLLSAPSGKYNRRLCWQLMPVLNLVVAVLRGSVGRVIAVLRDRLLLLSLLVERFVLTLINEDSYYY